MDEWMLSTKYIMPINLQWFANDEGGEKTEDATDKKLREAREEGKVAKSRELGYAFDLLALFLVLKIFISYVGGSLVAVFRMVYGNMDTVILENRQGVTSTLMASYINELLFRILLIVAPFFLFGFVITVLVNVSQVKWKVTTKPLQPKLDKFNPINGFKRIFSKDSLFELVKSVAKIAMIVIVAYMSIKDHTEEIFILYELGLNQAISLIGNLIIDVGIRISIVYMIVGIVDFAYQKRKFKEDMKMTKQEVKDEYKNTEGDPQIKGRIRSKMQEASRRRMMQDVPSADVVITNPTHLSVALKYDPEVNSAPYVVAKGADYIALRIREIARENQIEIVENKALARILYANVDINEAIPPEVYQAVAEILASIYNAKHNMVQGSKG